jgi:hypothetical protein
MLQALLLFLVSSIPVMAILFITNINLIIYNKQQRILQQATENFATSYRELAFISGLSTLIKNKCIIFI